MTDKVINLDEMWKEFRYSHTKNPHCLLNNRELFILFRAEINHDLDRIALIEPGCHGQRLFFH